MSSTERSKPKKRACSSGSQLSEHSDAGDRHPSNVKCPRPEEAQSQNRLRDLLHDKDFLWKVFGYLVEDGLHECRRVCRKWREVCSEFFAKSFRGHWKDLAEAHLKFPNAVNVSLSMLAPPPVIHNQDAWPSTVPSLTGIKCLKMDSAFLWNCQHFAQSPEMVCEYIASLVHLESLTLEGLREFMQSLVPSMAHLTNLTHLKIGSQFPATWDTTPLSGVRRLENLSLYAKNLFTVEGSLTFPSLTNLTQLEVKYRKRDDIILEVRDISLRTHSFFRSSHRRSIIGTRALCVDSEIFSHLLSLGRPIFQSSA